MKSLTVLLACLALAAVSKGYTDTGECPQVVHMEEFDLQRYSGSWYKIQEMPYDNNVTDPHQCLQIAYVMTSESTVGVGEVLFWSLSDTILSYYGNYSTTAVPGELAPSNGQSSVYILDTDYNTYASYYECSVDGEERYQKAAIISRTKELDPAIVESQKEILEASNVDSSLLVPVLQESYCTYFNLTIPPSIL